MRVRDIMSPGDKTVSTLNSIADAALIMRESDESCLVVLEAGEVSGVITERDLIFRCLIDGHVSWKCHVGRHMTHQVIVAEPEMLITEAVIRLVESEVDYLPVIDNGAVVGILSSRSFSRAIAMDAYRDSAEDTVPA